jgi:cell division protein FtsQ
LPSAKSEESKPAARGRAAARNAFPTARVILWSLAAGVLLVASLYGFHRLEQFLIRDPRFALNGSDNDDAPASLSVSGALHASHRAIEAVFAEDSGRSVYLVPLSVRRTTLASVSWVKDAAVARLWPNRLVVKITERTPVAFITLGSGRVALIDEDGVVLPAAKDRFAVPVLSGVHAADPLSERHDRVQRLIRLTKELGDAAQKISEVDVTDRDDVKVVEPFDGRLVTLLLGDRDFALRHQNFLNHFGEIQKKLPGASTLDLRLEDRITVVE